VYTVSNGDGASVKIWNPAQYPPMRPMHNGGGEYFRGLVSDDGNLLILAEDQQRLQWIDIATGREVAAIECPGPHPQNKWGVATLLPDGVRVAAWTTEATVALLDPNSPEPVRLLAHPGHPPWAKGIAASPDGRQIATVHDKDDLVIWDVDAGLTRVLSGARERWAPLIRYIDGGKHLLTLGPPGLAIWDPARNEPERWVAFKNAGDYNADMALVGDDRAAILDTKGKLALLDLRSEGAVWSLENVIGRRLAAPADGALLFTAGSDGAVRAWNAADGSHLRTFPDASSMHVMSTTRDQKLVSVREGTVYLWDLTYARRQQEMASQLQSARGVLAEHPDDGESLATFGRWYADHQVWGWAAEFLERARQNGAPVSSLLLARCYWQTGDAARAKAEFARAKAAREASDAYLQLCINAVGRAPSTAPAVVQHPSTGPGITHNAPSTQPQEPPP
jgi:WD40 repeat protein